MKTDTGHELATDDILRAVVIGGNVLGTVRSAKKTRRRVPRKQEQLIHAVAAAGRAGFEELASAFAKEWATIRKRRKGDYLLVAKRELFRNLADLAGRINEALAAGFRAKDSRDQLLGLTGDRFTGLAFDHQTMEIWWYDCQSLDDYLAHLHISADGAHVPFTAPMGNAPGEPQADVRPSPQGEADEAAVSAVPPPIPGVPTSSEHETAVSHSEPGFPRGDACEVEAPPPSSLLPDPSLAPIREPTLKPPPTSSRQPADPRLPEAERLSRPELATAVLEDFEEDPISHVWRFFLDGHRIELMPEYGYATIDGQFRRCPHLETLGRPKELQGPALRSLRVLIQRIEEDSRSRQE